MYFQIVEGQILSQKLSQLSTKEIEEEEEAEKDNSVGSNKKRQLSTPATPDIVSKKLRQATEIDDEDDSHQDKNQEHNIPEYLTTAKRFFDKVLISHYRCILSSKMK